MNHLSRTLIQLGVFWTFFLAVLPLGIMTLDPWATEGTRWGEVLFFAASALGVWCAVLMALRGEGTPLPLDPATKLVVSGPYRHIRNPMAVSGIAQGVGVGLLLGSPLVVAYALCGALVWNYAVRPWEEDDLLRRFGGDYLDYRDAVPCWLPRLTPYKEPVVPKDVISVNYYDLREVGEKRACPECKEGLLPLTRSMVTGRILPVDTCTLCGQQVEFLDIDKVKEARGEL